MREVIRFNNNRVQVAGSKPALVITEQEAAAGSTGIDHALDVVLDVRANFFRRQSAAFRPPTRI